MTTLETARCLIDLAVSLEPELTDTGIGVSRGEKFEAERAVLFGEEGLAMVATCADWLGTQLQIKTANRRQTSYSYKHSVERWVDERGSHQYISNGALIAAALGLGIGYRRTFHAGLNVFLCLSQKRLRETASPGHMVF